MKQRQRTQQYLLNQATPTLYLKGIGLSSSSGSVGRKAASYTRDPWFEFSHQLNLFTIYCIKSVLKRRKYTKEAGKGPFFKKALYLKMTLCRYNLGIPSAKSLALIQALPDLFIKRNEPTPASFSLIFCLFKQTI